MEYRTAGRKEIPDLCAIRIRQLTDEGLDPAPIEAELEEYFRRKLDDGTMVQWLAEDGGKIVATAAVLFLDLPPGFQNPSGIRGYITNMYTDPAYRGQGIASKMLDLLKEEAGKRDVHKLFLSASQMGRPVYRKNGFRETDCWMEADLRSGKE